MKILIYIKTALKVFLFRKKYSGRNSILSGLAAFLNNKLPQPVLKYFRRKWLFIINASLSAVIILIFFSSYRPNYDGEHINQFSQDDKICRLLLEDIKIFKEKYNGQGGGSIEPKLQIVLYKVNEGERLWDIHLKTGLSMDTLISMNPQKNVHILQPGQDIRIPNKDGIAYKIGEGETLESVAKEFDVNIEDIINVNELNESSIEEGKDVFLPNAKYKMDKMIELLGRFVNPLTGTGRMTSSYGPRRDPLTKQKSYHYGVDMANYAGAPVHAAESGRVIFCGTMGGYGKLIIINHANGYSTRYGHLSGFAVSHGRWVRQGQVIGYVGSTGHVTGPHLHFEIRKYGSPVNPYFLMRCTK